MRSILQPIMLYDNTVGSLELLFTANLGSVAVTVEGETGTVYQDAWQVTAGKSRSISTEEWEVGAYTLAVTANDGATYTWEFELVDFRGVPSRAHP